MDTFIEWLSRQFSQEGVLTYREWYLSLEKPFFAPAPEVFGIAWAFIYPLIALAFFYSVYLFYIQRTLPRGFLWLFILNLVLNLTFTPVALITRDNTLVSLHIILVLGTLAWLVLRAWKISKVLWVLLLPYLLWGAFATVLQLSITALN